MKAFNIDLTPPVFHVKHTGPSAMIDPSTIFQRTHSGREEIHNKSHGLTQSERLVLIMVDGVSSYSAIRAKLPVLTGERFDRALKKLVLKELVLEVFMPVEGQGAEELDRMIIDRFLQQDALDPVTIIFEDPDEVLGFHAPQDPPRPQQAATDTAPAKAAAAPIATPATLNTDATATIKESEVPSRAMDEQHARWADALGAEVRARQAMRPANTARAAGALFPESVSAPAPSPAANDFASVHWGWLLITGGLAFILGYVLGRIGA